MKYYKKSKVKYWFDTFEDLKPFQVFSTDKITSLYKSATHKFLSNDEGVEVDTGEPKSFIKERGVLPYYRAKFYGKDDLKFPPVDVYHKIKTPTMVYDRWVKADTSGHMVMVQNDVERDEHYYMFKNKSTSFLYLEIPHEFIRDFMVTTIITANHDNSNLNIMKSFMEDVLKSKRQWKPSNFIPILNEYDRRYPETVSVIEAGKNKIVYKWRHKIFRPELHISIKDFGLLYPSIARYPSSTIESLSQKKYRGGFNDILLYDGPHRLLTLPFEKSDYPIFIAVDKNNLDGDLFFITPPFFSDSKDWDIKHDYLSHHGTDKEKSLSNKIIKNRKLSSCLVKVNVSKKKIEFFLIDNNFYNENTSYKDGWEQNFECINSFWKLLSHSDLLNNITKVGQYEL